MTIVQSTVFDPAGYLTDLVNKSNEEQASIIREVEKTSHLLDLFDEVINQIKTPNVIPLGLHILKRLNEHNDSISANSELIRKTKSVFRKCMHATVKHRDITLISCLFSCSVGSYLEVNKPHLTGFRDSHLAFLSDIQLAIYFGHKELVEILIQHGANVDQFTLHGEPPKRRRT